MNNLGIEIGNNSTRKNLCISLANCDSEKEVIKTLSANDYWTDSTAWRTYGGKDQENNWSVIGNQSSIAEYALVEKITNSIDAVLIGECRSIGIDPEGKEAPKSIEEALVQFFSIYEGRLINISSIERTRLAEKISLIATGTKKNPSYTIIDNGEGQTPNTMPDTILSLGKTNKNKIPFVFGRYNQGGTAAFQFCGEPGIGNNLQLVISKRNPSIPDNKDQSHNLWGFTIVRREDPKKGEKNSTYRYLAPNNEIISFTEDTGLPLGPTQKYQDGSRKIFQYGTLIKLYEYQITGGLATSVNLNLAWRLSLLLPTLALPFRVFERRKGYRSHTYEATISGLSVRLDEDKRNNLETGFPSDAAITVQHQQINLQIFAFKMGEDGKNRKLRYAQKEGVIFTLDGQTHSYLPKSFYERKAVNMQYISNSVLVIADCSNMDQKMKNYLFMTSRDRHRHGPLFDAIESELEVLIKNHPGLKKLKEQRQHEDLKRKIVDQKQLEEALNKIIKISPVLSSLFLTGKRLSNPYKPESVDAEVEFVPKPFPTKFDLINKCSEDSPKICPINARFRMQYATDVENDYFQREKDQGNFQLTSTEEEIVDHSGNLWNGIYNINISLPKSAKVDDIILYESSVMDISLSEPFTNEFYIKISEPIIKNKITDRQKRRKKSGPKVNTSKQKDISDTMLAMPKIHQVRGKDWNRHGMTKMSALIVKELDTDEYAFFINLDNHYLLNEIKAKPKIDPELFETQFETGIVLIGLSILLKQNETFIGDTEDVSIYELVNKMTEVISPVIIPMINTLSKLD